MELDKLNRLKKNLNKLKNSSKDHLYPSEKEGIFIDSLVEIYKMLDDITNEKISKKE